MRLLCIKPGCSVPLSHIWKCISCEVSACAGTHPVLSLCMLAEQGQSGPTFIKLECWCKLRDQCCEHTDSLRAPCPLNNDTLWWTFEKRLTDLDVLSTPTHIQILSLSPSLSASKYLISTRMVIITIVGSHCTLCYAHTTFTKLYLLSNTLFLLASSATIVWT